MLGCLSCINSTYCQFCQSDYYLSTADSLCHSCEFTMPGCYACTGPLYCSICKGGYILNNDTFLCD